MLRHAVLLPLSRLMAIFIFLIYWVSAERTQEERGLDHEPNGSDDLELPPLSDFNGDDHELPPVGKTRKEKESSEAGSKARDAHEQQDEHLEKKRPSDFHTSGRADQEGHSRHEEPDLDLPPVSSKKEVDHELPPVSNQKNGDANVGDDHELPPVGNQKKETLHNEDDLDLPPVSSKKEVDHELPPVNNQKKETLHNEDDLDLPPVSSKKEVDHELPPVNNQRRADTYVVDDHELPPVHHHKEETLHAEDDLELPPVANRTQDSQGSTAQQKDLAQRGNVAQTEDLAQRGDEERSSGQSQIVTREEFVNAMAASDKAMRESQVQLKEAFASFFSDAMTALRGEMRESFALLKEIHKDGLDRVKHLATQERRLEVAILHGSVGKCCCKRAAGSGIDTQCHWTKQIGLVGQESKQCELDMQEYTDDLNSRSMQLGKTEESFLDQCAESPSWLEHATNQLVNDVKDCSPKLDRDMNTLEAFLQS